MSDMKQKIENRQLQQINELYKKVKRDLTRSNIVVEVLKLECFIGRLENKAAKDNSKIFSDTLKKEKIKLNKLYAKLEDKSCPVGKVLLLSDACREESTELHSMPSYYHWKKQTNKGLFYKLRPKKFGILDSTLKELNYLIKDLNLDNSDDINDKIYILHDKLIDIFNQAIELLKDPAIKESRHKALWYLLKKTLVAIGFTIDIVPELKNAHVLTALLKEDLVVGRFKYLVLNQSFGKFYDDAFLTPNRNESLSLIKKYPVFDDGCEITLIGDNNNPTYSLTTKLNQKKVVFRQISRDKENMRALELINNSRYKKYIAKTIYSMATGKIGDDGFLEVVEFLNEGNFQQVIDTSKPGRDRAQQAMHYLLQLSEIMQSLSELGVFFPDLKPSNLMLKRKKFILSDTKSLIPFDKNTREATTRVMSTHIYTPPEQASENPPSKINVDHYHSYQVGLTICLYAVGLKGNKGPYKIKADKNNGQHAHDFIHKRFKKETLLGNLLQGLMNPEPTERMLLSQAIRILRKEQILKMKKSEAKELGFFSNKIEQGKQDNAKVNYRPVSN